MLLRLMRLERGDPGDAEDMVAVLFNIMLLVIIIGIFIITAYGITNGFTTPPVEAEWLSNL